MSGLGGWDVVNLLSPVFCRPNLQPQNSVPIGLCYVCITSGNGAISPT